MKKTVFLAALACLLAGCTAHRIEDTLAAGQESSEENIYGLELSQEDVYPDRLTVLFDEETAVELEEMTGEDGLVALPQVKAFDGSGIIRMKRLFPYAGRFEARTRREGLHRWYEVYYDASVSLTKSAKGLVAIPGVEIVEFNPVIRIVGDPELVEEVPAQAASSSSGLPFDDPRLPSQWHYLNKGTVSSSSSGCDINVVPVWKRYTTGSPEVIVGVVDGGIDFNHEDLAANMWHNPEKKGDAQYGYNFVDDNYLVTPDSHGTHVAGTIAAVNNNGIGVAGIAGGNAAEGLEGVKLMSCQIFEGDDATSGSSAIKWSADHGAVISQNSWGFKENIETPKSLKAAVDYFIKYAGIDEDGVQTGPMRGGIVIFAAGNENRSSSASDYDPIFNVAAVGADFRRAYYSNYGKWVDISAPGGDVKKGNQVLSTLPDNKYGYYQGTSMACPHVSGVAALIVSKFQGEGLTPAEVEQRLVESATPISSFNKSFLMGAGLVNAYRAIAGSGGTAPEVPTDLELSAQSNNVHVKVTVPRDEDDGVPASIIIFYSENYFDNTDSDLMFGRIYLEDEEAGDTIEGKLTGLEFNKQYYFAAVAEDLAGNRSGLTECISLTTGGNNPPEIDVKGSAELVIKPHQTAQIDFHVFDPDGHTFVIKFYGDTTNIIIDTLDFEYPKAIVRGPDTEAGTYVATLVATDYYGAENSVDMSITVLENHPPVIVSAFGDRVFTQGVATEVLDCSDFFYDEDGEELAYRFDISNPTVVNMTYQEGKFYMTPMNYGYSDVSVTGTDIRGESASQTFRVLVRDGSQDVDIYPNPVSDYLYVRTSANASAGLKLVNMMGAVVWENTLTITPFEPASIDVRALPTGLYTVTLDYGGNITSRQVLKK